MMFRVVQLTSFSTFPPLRCHDVSVSSARLTYSTETQCRLLRKHCCRYWFIAFFVTFLVLFLFFFVVSFLKTKCFVCLRQTMNIENEEREKKSTIRWCAYNLWIVYVLHMFIYPIYRHSLFYQYLLQSVFLCGGFFFIRTFEPSF